ncbi:MAG TPA: bifunctional nicotinamidase/pyrazinamidase [Aridibacter sp.]|nr:bifunctional nicotinamidase/pyrazinamidase [Aridibacter sp.]
METLIIIDVQNDFMPGGSLAVPEGDEIVPVINGIQSRFDLIIATQDWHPPDHKSFASNHEGKNPFETVDLNGIEQTLWPDHCVQGTSGAEMHPDLDVHRIEAVFRKGMDPEIDSYSGFFDNRRGKSTGLTGYQREKGAEHLNFCGLAGDICVYYSLMDALHEGFRSTLVENAVRALDRSDFENAKAAIAGRGAAIVNLS